jgi:hypothetical protein
MKKIKKWLVAAFEWLFQEDPPGYCRENREDEMNLFHMVLFILCNLMFCIKVPGYEWVAYIARVWPFIGIACIIHRLFAEAEYYKSSWWTEFVMACKLNDFFMCLYIWPFQIWRCFKKECDPNSTFRAELHDQLWHRKYRTIRMSAGHDNAVFTLRDMGKQLVEETKEQSDELKQIPVHIALSAKTSAACGATAVVVATTPVASAGDVPKTTNAIIEVSSYGWVTGVAQRPIENKGEREDTEELRHARLRTIVKSKPLNLQLFTEIDGAQLQEPRQDWFKQYYLSWKPEEHTTLSIGRLAVAPLWMVPPPFLLESVSYPRLPYSFIGYGIDADMRRGNWRVIADITGTTGLKFTDEGQFSRPEGHLRVEYGRSPACVYAVSGQTSEDFIRTSLDVNIKPTPWMDLKGATYHSRARSPDSWTESTGGYAYIGLRPIQSLPQVEVHGQADYQYSREGVANPLILTAGARVLFNKGKQSVTLDYQHADGVGSARDTGTLQLRLQTRF